MGLLSNLISKIFSHAETAPGATGGSSATQAAPASQQVATAQPATSATATAVAAPPVPAAAPPQLVDVTAILQGLAAKNSEKLDWKKSIVDLMKLVGMDSSFSARKQLAKELNYTGDSNDSASMNIWLHKQVMKKLAENGGKVPADLLH